MAVVGMIEVEFGFGLWPWIGGAPNPVIGVLGIGTSFRSGGWCGGKVQLCWSPVIVTWRSRWGIVPTIRRNEIVAKVVGSILRWFFHGNAIPQLF